MSFTSTLFYILLPISILIFYLIPKSLRYIWLLFVSFAFYTSLNSSFTTLLIISILITWFCGNWIYSSEKKSTKKLIMALGLIANLSILAVFKYSDFVLSLFGTNKTFNLILPAGISFYTFQSLTYIFDLYNEKLEPEKNIFKYALFVSFFPLILSGPIERASRLLPQFNFNNNFDSDIAKDGLKMMLFGYFLKIVVVARLSILTDAVFNFYSERSSLVIICGVIGYAIQIYADFHGYSLIAIGICKIMGINIMNNFKQPYFSTSIADFWRRWHISLSSWFKDYLYIPLGGNRKGTLRKYLNIMIVFTLSGLWHGANLTFILWGFLNGLYQMLGDLCKPIKSKIETLSLFKSKAYLYKSLQILVTFVLINFTWIFFRSHSISEAFSIIKTIFIPHEYTNFAGSFISNFGLGAGNLLILLLAVAFLFICDCICEVKSCDVSGLLLNANALIRWIIYYTLIMLILFSMNLNMTEFIYQAF